MGHTEVVSVLQLITDCWKFDTEPHVQGQWAESEAKMLIEAARTGNLSVVITLLSVCSPDTSIPDVETGAADPPDLSNTMVGERALMQAIRRGHKDIVIHLLYHGVSLNNRLPWRLLDIDQDYSEDSILSIPRKVEMGCFGLHLAIAQNNREMVKLLLGADVDPELGVDDLETEMDIEGKWISPLAHASAIGNIGIAQDLLEYGASIEGQGVSSATWEGLRFRHGNLRILTPGIAASGHAVSPAQFRYFQLRSFATEEGGLQFRYTTPLIQAAGSGHLSMMEYLMNAGADIDNYDSAGNTPLSVVAAEGHIEAAKLLIQKGASLGYDTRTEKIPRLSPVVEATKCGNLEMLELLLEAGADFKTSIQSETAVIIAVVDSNLEVVELLLKHGADVNVEKGVWRSKRWRSIPLCRAIKANDKPMVELLLSHGADPLWTAGWGKPAMTPLQMAQEHAHFSAAEIVLDFHKRQIKASADGLTDSSTELRISQEAELDLHSELDMKTTDMTFAREAELISESDTESTILALVCGVELDLSLESPTESLIVDT
jgi:ankyrin repeat protein